MKGLASAEHKTKTMSDNARMQSLQMNNILFYVVFSRHSSFVSMLIKDMIVNIKEIYKSYTTMILALDVLVDTLDKNIICHNHVVVLFFFFLSIDCRMRHWILNSQQTQEGRALRDKYLNKQIELIPGGTASLSRNTQTPFLGQSVVFAPLQPHVAVPIMMAISDETFFEEIIGNQTAQAIDDVFDKIKTTIVLA